MGHEQCTKANEQCLKFGGVNSNLKIFFFVFSNKFLVFNKINGIQTHPRSAVFEMNPLKAT